MASGQRYQNEKTWENGPSAGTRSHGTARYRGIDTRLLGRQRRPYSNHTMSDDDHDLREQDSLSGRLNDTRSVFPQNCSPSPAVAGGGPDIDLSAKSQGCQPIPGGKTYESDSTCADRRTYNGGSAG